MNKQDEGIGAGFMNENIYAEKAVRFHAHVLIEAAIHAGTEQKTK